MKRIGGVVGSALALRAGVTGFNPGPGENFSLKLKTLLAIFESKNLGIILVFSINFCKVLKNLQSSKRLNGD